MNFRRPLKDLVPELELEPGLELPKMNGNEDDS